MSKNVSKGDTIKGGSSTNILQALSSDKIKAKFADVFKSKLPLGLPPHKNVEHKIELILGANPVASPPLECVLIIKL